MEEPNLNELVRDMTEEASVKKIMGKSPKVKITLNIDRDLLDILRQQSEETDVPYQRLINRYTRQALQSGAGNEMQELRDTISKLAKEVAELKAQIA